MTFPRKNTHSVSLRNGQTFQWHLNADWDREYRWIVVTEQGNSGQLLFIDPYASPLHAAFLPGQATIRNAIRAGFRWGWAPAQKKAPLCLRYDGTDFVPTQSPSWG